MKLFHFFLLLIISISTNLSGKNEKTSNEDTRVKILRDHYLDLMKKTVLNTIYEPASYKENGSSCPKHAHSMIGMKRMNNLQMCIEDILANDIPGDFIETGVWRGGATIFMRAILKAYGDTSRTVWGADSFEGLPKPNTAKCLIDQDCSLYQYKYLSVSLDEVKNNFMMYDLLDNQVSFLKGFFKDIMRINPIKQLALMRLDGDMYESTLEVLENLYDKLSVGGYVIIDDYLLKWARKATDDFRRQRNILDPLIDIDGIGAYWQKTHN